MADIEQLRTEAENLRRKIRVSGLCVRRRNQFKNEVGQIERRENRLATSGLG